MSLVALSNLREVWVPLMVESAPPYAPTSTEYIGFGIAPTRGRVKQLLVAVAVAGAIGDSTNHRQWLRVQNLQYIGPGAGLLVVTGDAVIKSALPSELLEPAAGTIVAGKSREIFVGRAFFPGEIIGVRYHDSGTLGTGTRAQFNVLGVIFEAAQHLDSSI